MGWRPEIQPCSWILSSQHLLSIRLKRQRVRFKGKSDNSNNKFVDTETEQSRLELTHRVTLLAEVASGFLFFFSLEPGRFPSLC
ncbi:hypothetical protein LWI29_016682 [Acer saccharum]|uniref:Uncharacterized protein n=1 Tax=Acer saccharum TaxID=4024 RepID=A0AA39S8Z3_ACESA|nr:hypothetical protein LWI29_016682 [Acer saccharum]